MASDLAKKLLLHKAQRALILNEPKDCVNSLQSQFPDHVEMVDSNTSDVDFILLFAFDSGDVNHLFPLALRVGKPDALLWVSYLKKSSKIKSDLNRDILVSRLHEFGYEGVSLVSIDDTWSAMRARPRKE